jgi:hypothetical protein
MLALRDRISAFEKLGRFMGQVREKSMDDDLQRINEYFLEGLHQVIREAELYNNWFTPENVHYAFAQWSDALTESNLHQWVNRYPMDHFENEESRTIAVVMAGNIPLVGFHDFLSILISGHKILVKPSADDNKILPYLAQVLVAIERNFAERISFAEGKITDFDAVIATGSDNSARYFDYYFGKYPHIIRKNRTSVAVLNGKEDEPTLVKLGEDIFRYFGLGCRNVSKIYIPKDYDLDRLFKAFYGYSGVIDNKKYGNNYDYNRAVLMMEKEDFLENGFMIIKKSEALHAPVSVVYVEEYDAIDVLSAKLEQDQDKLQCVVSEIPEFKESITFGTTQQPHLWDYADGIDTIRFLRGV